MPFNYIFLIIQFIIELKSFGILNKKLQRRLIFAIIKRQECFIKKVEQISMFNSQNAYVMSLIRINDYQFATGGDDDFIKVWKIARKKVNELFANIF